MSHFTRVRTKLRDLQLLDRALRDLGYQPSLGRVRVRGWDGESRAADLVVQCSNRYDFGFRRDGDELVMILDEWGFRDEVPRLLERITQRYAYHVCLQQAAAQGFQVVATEEQLDGSLKLVVQRYA
ncbi:MAG: DUF1257 domain-containing protein [Fimbriimonadaceae bacterium]|nr:DUF1257 domain-containing protein [Fimbriimonadaceae bacterium]